MIEDIWMAISVGRRVLKTLGALKKDVETFRSSRARGGVHQTQMEALDKRTNDLEMLTREQESRIEDIEKSLEDALTATEALAQRVGTIYWIAVAGCAVSVPALVISVIALILRR
jgi:predicted RNase H-like nuclease (RuvC/YqgF family)